MKNDYMQNTPTFTFSWSHFRKDVDKGQSEENEEDG